MNHFGELRNLVSFVRPHVALITTIAPAHLEFFGNCEAIADAKSEIFEGLLPGGAALIPADSPYAERLKARARQAQVSRIVSFGAERRRQACISLRPKAQACGSRPIFWAGRWIVPSARRAPISPRMWWARWRRWLCWTAMC